MKKMTTVCVFCGSSIPTDPDFLSAAKRVGELIAQNNLTLLYGAGKTGMMGAVAESCIAASGKVIGVTHEWEARHSSHMDGLANLDVMKSLPERKARMIEIADAFIILPGGIGTIDEFFEVLANSQIGTNRKPLALLNVKGYFDALLTWFERAAGEGYISQGDLGLFIIEQDVEVLLKLLQT